jgi:hypothetical protein
MCMFCLVCSANAFSSARRLGLQQYHIRQRHTVYCSRTVISSHALLHTVCAFTMSRVMPSGYPNGFQPYAGEHSTYSTRSKLWYSSMSGQVDLPSKQANNTRTRLIDFALATEHAVHGRRANVALAHASEPTCRYTGRWIFRTAGCKRIEKLRDRY